MAKKKVSNKTNDNASSKDRLLIMVISILLGGGLGFGIAKTVDSDNVSTNSTETTTSHAHTEKYEVTEAEAPKLELVVSEDKKSGYNIKVIATDFTFTPEHVNEENVMNEGHAHLYIDGEKIARLYGPYYHWDGSFEGSKEFKVTLNANDHSEYAINGETIEAKETVSHDSDAEDHSEAHSDDNTTESSDHTH